MASTEQLAAIGDRAWRAMLNHHGDIADRLLGRYRGRLVHVTGDGLVAVFDAPARAIGCACAIRDSLFNLLGLEIRAGLHTGEVEQRRADITGLAVHIAQRVQALAPAGAVFVSRTIVDLVAGSGISFTEIGERTLKGVPNPCHIYAVRQ